MRKSDRSAVYFSVVFCILWKKEEIMKRFKLWLCSLCLLMPMGFAACAGETNKEEVSLSLSKTAIELTVGETEQLTVSVSPSDALDKMIEWKSEDEAVVVVDDGMITAKAEGETKVIATSNGKSVSCKVTVKK